MTVFMFSFANKSDDEVGTEMVVKDSKSKSPSCLSPAAYSFSS